MKTEKLDTYAGESFDRVAEKAHVIATNRKCLVEFDFNGVKCIVSESTDLKLLYRDYSNSFTMDWKVIGPYCLLEYKPEVQAELSTRRAASEEKNKRQADEYRKKEEAEKALFQAKTAGIEMEFSDKDAWDKGRAKNTDPYGNCCYVYAEGWAKLMQKEIAEGKALKDIASPASFELGFLGISGFMYGVAVSILSQCWIHGEELRKWHTLKG